MKPKTKTQIWSFIGLTSYYQKSVPQFTEHSVSFTAVTKKAAPPAVEWIKEMENAFDHLKNHYMPLQKELGLS